ncbi:hypothetical protein ACF09E_30775 [Streptomyces sp. NPDC014891]|uniref:hypothetical protein n=1 Tax=Streptomyces sp. NPDC014891 TaxID=3364929 RepID=UPI0036F826EE
MNAAATEVRRTLLIVLLSHDSRTILLERGPDASTWLPLSIDVPSHRSYAQVVHRWRQPRMRRASVTARMATRVGHVRSDYRVVIFKLPQPARSARFSPQARWWPISDLETLPVFPQELGFLMTGYVQGWIPDGPITLNA